MGLPTVLVLLFALGVVLLWIDVLFTRGAMMHGAAAMMNSPYGWVLIVALVILVLVIFGLVVGQR